MARLDPMTREDEVMDCIHDMHGMDYDRWWSLSELARAKHLAHFRLRRLREGLLAKVQEEVRDKFKDAEKPDAVQSWLGGMM